MDKILKKIFISLFEGFALWRKSKNHANLMETLRIRMIFSCVCGVFMVATISYKLADIMIISRIISKDSKNLEKDGIIKKADIIDRNGEILATSIMTASCFADPSVIIDLDETAKKLSKIPGMPSIDKIKYKLKDKNKHFVWLARHITPQFQQQVLDMGLPGISFLKDYKRIYTHAALFSHIIGCQDIDGKGVCGIEKKFNDQLIVKNFSDKKLRLTLDLRLQSIVHEELQAAVEKFKAIGGNAILMKISGGEVLSMVSLPEFDPNNLKSTTNDAMFNRNTLGVFEPGSTFKILNVAIALESGSAKINSMFDATSAIKMGRHKISDFKGKNRALTLAEAFVFSSNIAAVKIEQTFGPKLQKEYMKKFGVLEKPGVEIPEVAYPILPAAWNESAATTISYGYGVSVSPIQLLTVISSIVNNGRKVTPTFLYNHSVESNESIVSKETSETIRDLMRAVVCYGTAKKAGVEGISIFGKTGTAYKMTGKGYGSDANRARITTFVGGFPKENPQYMLLVTLDNPKAIEGTYGYATAGWNVAPTAKNIFERIIPMLIDGESCEDTELKVAKYINLR